MHPCDIVSGSLAFSLPLFIWDYLFESITSLHLLENCTRRDETKQKGFEGLFGAEGLQGYLGERGAVGNVVELWGEMRRSVLVTS